MRDAARINPSNGTVPPRGGLGRTGHAVETSPAARSLRAGVAGRAALLVLLTALAYVPALRGGFIWDDDLHLVDHVVLRENGLYRAWFTTEALTYWPVTWTSYWIEHRLWGLNPIGYHAVNVLIHAGCGLLIWGLFERLRIPGGWLAALIFAVHPVNVESVAWITQRKTTLSFLLALLSLRLYLRFDATGGRPAYGAALICFVAAMLSKGTVAPLPAVLLLCAWWLRGRVTRRDVLRSVPFFAASALFSAIEIIFQYGRAIGDNVVREDGPLARAAGAAWAFWFYLYKALLPFNLTFIYPKWRIDPAHWAVYVPGLLLVLLMLFVGAAARRRRAWGRAALFALAYYLITLSPVLGFLDTAYMMYSLVADHYQYMSIIAVIGLAVAGAAGLARRTPSRHARRAAHGLAAVVVLGLAGLTWRQSGIYESEQSVWRDTLRKNPGAWLARNNLAILLQRQGQLDEAVELFREALRDRPDWAEAHSNLGIALARRGDLEGAVAEHRRAIQIKPDFADAHSNLGAALMQLGRTAEAIGQYREALRLRPDLAVGHYNLAEACQRLGRLDEAVEHYRRALDLDPQYSAAHNNLGLALQALGRTDEAAEQFRAAIAAAPQNAEAHFNLANRLAADGQTDAAAAQYRAALALRPGYAAARNNLANLLAATGQTDAAIEEYRRALSAAPAHANARYNLALALHAAGRDDECIAELREVLRIRPDHAEAHHSLGLVLRGRGELDSAIGHFEEALRWRPGFAAARADLEAARKLREQGAGRP